MDATDEMPAERANRIADAVEDIERNVSRLRERQSLSRDEYKAEGNHDLRDATGRKFEKLAEAVLDIAEAILKEEDETVPSRRKETIAAVERAGVVGPELSDRLQEAIEFSAMQGGAAAVKERLKRASRSERKPTWYYTNHTRWPTDSHRTITNIKTRVDI